jgi:hypothetical protein
MLRSSALMRLSNCGATSASAFAAAGASILGAVDVSIGANTAVLGQVGASVSAIEQFAASLNAKLAGAGKLAVSAQATLAENALAAVFGAGSVQSQTSACAGVLGQVDASISAGVPTLAGRCTLFDAASIQLTQVVGVSASGSVSVSVSGSIDASIGAGFTTALDAKLGACSLSADAKAALRASAIASFNGCGKTEFGAQASFGAGVLAAVDVSIKANTSVLGSVSATVNGIAEFAASLKAKLSGAAKLSASAQASLQINAFAAVFGAGAASAQTSACAGVLGGVQASISAGVTTLAVPSATAGVSVTASPAGPAMASMTGAPLTAAVYVNVTTGFTTAIDFVLAKGSLEASDKASLRSSALQQLLDCTEMTFDSHAAYGSTIIGAVVDAIAAHQSTLPVLTATVDAVQTFAASLLSKINGCSLGADDKVKLTAAALAAVYEAGSVDAQVAICDSVLAKVDASISAHVSVLGGVQVSGSASGGTYSTVFHSRVAD